MAATAWCRTRPERISPVFQASNKQIGRPPRLI
jgi:hypothetical protein